MGSEHVRVTADERRYGEHELLQTQLALLSTVKRLRAYKSLRKDEMTLKIGLKAKLNEALTLISEIEHMLPNTEYKVLLPHKPKDKKKEQKEEKKEKDREFTLEEEIDLIKQRLASLGPQVEN